MSSKKELKQVNNDCWVFILLLTTIAILIQSLKNYNFVLFSQSISYKYLLLPGIYFISNFILKKYDYKKAIAGIAISAVISVSFIVMIYFGMGKNFVLLTVCGDFLAYVVSQYVNLFLYEYLQSNSSAPYYLTFLIYIFSILIYLMVYTLVYLNSVIIGSYWVSYIIILVIEIVLCLIVSYYDKKIKKD